jgi:hypothetical protein
MSPKKSFKQNNPAMGFITQEPKEEPKEQEQRPQTQTPVKKKAPQGYKRNPEFVETKSKRKQLLIQPSVSDALESYAGKNGISVNETINIAIKEFLERAGELK